MMWFIASLPFWFVGAMFFYTTVQCVTPGRFPDETRESLAAQAFIGLILGSIMWVIAAWVGS